MGMIEWEMCKSLLPTVEANSTMAVSIVLPSDNLDADAHISLPLLANRFNLRGYSADLSSKKTEGT